MFGALHPNSFHNLTNLCYSPLISPWFTATYKSVRAVENPEIWRSKMEVNQVTLGALGPCTVISGQHPDADPAGPEMKRGIGKGLEGDV